MPRYVLWPDVTWNQQFWLQRSSNEKLSFYEDSFSLIFLYGRYENDIDTIVFVSSSRFETCTFWLWMVDFKIWPQVKSGQGHVMTQIGQYVYLPKRLDGPSRLSPFLHLYLHPVASYRRKKKMDCDLMCPQITFLWSPTISCTRIVTYGEKGYDPERIECFLLVYAKRKTFTYFPVGL